MDERIRPNNSYVIEILIFLFLFFLLILIARPALIMTDETITANQLHQISIGHQFLINECKYGCLPDGSPSSYYIARNNILGYTIFLPIISLPALMIFSIGDQFRLSIILFWSIIPLLIAILIHANYQNYSRISRIPLLYVGTIISILLLMLNLYYYHPFPLTLPNAPGETGAIILTNCILGSILGVVIYRISLVLFHLKKIALFGVYAIFCSSSYLFWSGTAKDHILSTLLIAIIILCFVITIKENKHGYIYAGFFFIGILAWNRPEMGFGILIAALIFQIIKGITTPSNLKPISKTIILSIIATFLGSVPLFINNYVTTNNPFTPPFWYYKSNTVPQGAQIWSSAPITDVTSYDLPEPLIHLFLSIIPDISQIDIFRSIGTVFLNPPAGNLSIFPIAPIFFTGGCILLITTLFFRKKINTIQIQDKQVIILLCIFLAGVILPYFHVMQGYIPGNRPGPDIRYFIPIYMIGGLIGLYPFVLWCKESIQKVFRKRNLGVLVLFPIIITSYIIKTEPFGGPGDGYRGIYLIAVYGLILVNMLLFFHTRERNKCHDLLTIALILLISIPLIWQLTFSYYYAIGRFNGYPYWISFMEYLYELYVPYAWK